MLCGLRNICFLIGIIVMLLIFWSSSTSVSSVADWRPDMSKVDLKNPLNNFSPKPSTPEVPQLTEEELAEKQKIKEEKAKAKAEAKAEAKKAKEAANAEAQRLEAEAKAASEKSSAKKLFDAALGKLGGKKGNGDPGPGGPMEPDANSEFNEVKYMFQQDLTQYDMPDFDAHSLRRYKPHNYRGPGHETFATYYSTRNATVHDPYFLAAQQMAYRLLWDPRSKSNKHPLTVFVAPFVPDEQRDLLAAAGAIVRELDLVPWHPAAQTYARWRDLFSKLNMWGQTDFSRITFLDLDAFPVNNIDKIFDLAPSKRCDKAKLPAEDKPMGKEICQYTFTGTEVPGYAEINVGVMVFSPNRAMHTRLLREYLNTDKYDSKMAEQAFLSYAYSVDGPFPANFISREWNGFFPQAGDEGAFNIIHEKLWAENEHLPWARDYFNGTWADMLELYESEAFVDLRKADGLREY
jgi:alpha-N-acetylglucosamine transferase